jgi:nucleotide-binding universal stress UspA family protein
MTDSGLRQILVGLEGSPDTEAVIELSLRWARATGARLVGLGVIDEPTIRGPEPVPLGASHYKHEWDESRLAEARHRIADFLHDFGRRCADHGVAGDVLTRVGVPHEQLVLEAQRHDLVVLARRSHFHFETERGEHDDTVERVVQHCARPVVTVPAPLTGTGPVVIAYDGGVHAARALQAFVCAGIESGSDVLVVSPDADEVEAAARAENAIAFLVAHGIAGHRASITNRAPVAQTILQVVEETDARLLVAGARSNRRLTHLLFGSVSRAFLAEAKVPVFLCG